ncbi:MAG TPA: hypothetical protein PK570_10320 [Thermoanaerobaculia bacterium]|nr:hypothetical protein [Thermoanaerobaculia bacterium]
MQVQAQQSPGQVRQDKRASLAAGRTLVEAAPEYGPAFRELLATIRATVAPAAPVALAAAGGGGR